MRYGIIKNVKSGIIGTVLSNDIILIFFKKTTMLLILRGETKGKIVGATLVDGHWWGKHKGLPLQE